MKFDNFALSKKYAKAFLASFYPVKQTAPLTTYQELVTFFKTHPGIIGLIAGCPCPQPCYNQLEEFLIKKFQLTGAEQKLIHRLLLDRTITLLPAVFEHIIMLEHSRSNMIVCTIETSHEISQEWQELAIQAFEKMTKKIVIPTFKVKTELICGIRAYSSTFSFEKSLKKSLCAAELFAKYKGGLW